MNGMQNKSFLGNHNENINMFQLNIIRKQRCNTQPVFNFNQETIQLQSYCHQIFSSFKVQENEVSQITFDLQPLKEIVTHLIEVDSKILIFDIDIMIDLKIHEFIANFILKIVGENFTTDEEILINLLHLISIWSNGTIKQNQVLFDPSFLKYFLYFCHRYFIFNLQVVDYSLRSLKNLLIIKIFPNSFIPNIIMELILLSDRYLSEAANNCSIINNTFLHSIECIFLCIQVIIRNYFNSEFFKLLPNEINGIMTITKKWIDFIQRRFFYINTYIDDEDNNNDDFTKEIDDNAVCDSLCSAIICMNDIIKAINETADLFFTKEFIQVNLVCYLRSTNLNLKKNGLRTLKRALTVIGNNNFSAWDLMDERIWRVVESVTQYENNPDIKLYFIKVISSILAHLPSTIEKQLNNIKMIQDHEMNNHNNFDIQIPADNIINFDAQEINTEQTNHDVQDLNEIEDDDDNNDFNNHELNEIGNVDDYEEEEEDVIINNHEAIISSSLSGRIMILHDAGIFGRLLSLSDSKDEPIEVRITAMLAIAQNIRIFNYTEIFNLINGNIILVLIGLLEIIDVDRIEFIFGAFSVIFDYIERFNDKDSRYIIVDGFEQCDAEQLFKDMLVNPIYEGKFDQLISYCLDKLDELRNKLTKDQRIENEKKREKNRMRHYFQISIDDEDILKEYEEEEENNDVNDE